MLMVQEEKMQSALSTQPRKGWHVISLLCFVLSPNVLLFQHSNGLVHSRGLEPKIKMCLCNWFKEHLNSSLLSFLRLIRFECLEFFFF